MTCEECDARRAEPRRVVWSDGSVGQAQLCDDCAWDFVSRAGDHGVAAVEDLWR